MFPLVLPLLSEAPCATSRHLPPLPPNNRRRTHRRRPHCCCWCCTCAEFVHLVSSQANEVAERDGRSTINPEHVMRALEELEMGGSMAAEVNAAWEAWKKENKSE